MTTLVSNREQIERSIVQSLSHHRDILTSQQQRVESLAKSLAASQDGSVAAEDLNAMVRLIDAIEHQHQVNDRIYDVLTSLTQAKEAQPLTVANDKLVNYLQLGLSELAQRLKIEPVTRLAAATNHLKSWSRLMAAHPDPEGYQWEFPKSKRGLGFYHRTKVQVFGTKIADVVANQNTSN